MIDLRSDTVTRPTPEMRRVIADADVGDDLFGDDPTVRRLEEHVAAILGKEDAVYVASGTMSNQAALFAHTRAGDIVLAAEGAHIAHYEAGAPAALSGITIAELDSDAGTFTAEAVASAVAPVHHWVPEAVVQPVTLLATENTHNGAGGTIWPLQQLEAVATTARDAGLATHMDGARVWNASAASGVSPGDYAAPFDTVSVCFSKGLGAPIGSALAGSLELTTAVRRSKQLFGGGWRQAGMMAAGALYALENHRERLVTDHANASRLAAGLAETPGLAIDAERVQTNLVYFDVEAMPATEFCERVHSRGTWMLPMSATRVRAVTHLGIATEDIEATLAAVAAVMDEG